MNSTGVEHFQAAMKDTGKLRHVTFYFQNKAGSTSS